MLVIAWICFLSVALYWREGRFKTRSSGFGCHSRSLNFVFKCNGKLWRIVTKSDCYFRKKTLLSQRWSVQEQQWKQRPVRGLMQRSRWEMIAAKIITLVKWLDSSSNLIAEPVELTGGLDSSVEGNNEHSPRSTPRIYKEAIKTIATGGRTSWHSAGFKNENSKQMIKSEGSNFEKAYTVE